MAVNDITPVSERITPAYPLVGIRRPIVFTCIAAPLVLWFLWELLSK